MWGFGPTDGTPPMGKILLLVLLRSSTRMRPCEEVRVVIGAGTKGGGPSRCTDDGRKGRSFNSSAVYRPSSHGTWET